MKLRFPRRLLALGLVLSLALTPAAQALTLEQARELLNENYIDEVPEEVLTQTTIPDMLEALGDPYTVYFTPEEYAAFNSTMEDSSIVGIGVSSSQAEEGLRIEHVYDDSPAQDAGLKAGDIITAVSGRSTVGVAAETAATWLRGDAGTGVTVTYLRDGVSRTITLIRRKVIIPATTIRVEDGHIGLIECTTFGNETLEHFGDGITSNSEVDHWIVDLRSNSGGSIDAAIQSVGLFTGWGVLAYLRDGSGEYSVYGINGNALTDYPVIVLTNPYTASASELFAAAVRDKRAGICVGERTYGKGVAQSVFDKTVLPDYFPDGDALKITAYRFFSPAGNTTDTVGVIPHLLVPQSAAAEVAKLLCTPNPQEDTSGLLALRMGGWRWYIQLDTALNEENRDYFTLLLEAIPASATLLEGTDSPDGWVETTPAAVASAHGLDYQSRGFSDTADSPYARQIDILATYGILLGDGSGTFNPEGSLTRAQLCALLYQALGGTAAVGESRFSDVSSNAWYGQAVNALSELGLVEGVGNGTFRPDDPVTHEQFVAIMGRMATLLNMYFYETVVPEDLAQMSELSGWADWAKEETWLLTLSQNGRLGNTIHLLWEDPEEIDPLAVTTREEAASLVYSLFSYTGILPV